MEFIQMFRQFFDRKSSDTFSMRRFGSSGDFKSHRIQFVAFFWPLVAQVFRCRFCFRGILYLPLSICLEFGGDLHPLADGRIQLDRVVVSQSVFPIWWSAQFSKRPVRHLCHIWWSAQFLPRIYQPCLSQSHQCVSINPQFSPKNPPTKQDLSHQKVCWPNLTVTGLDSHWWQFKAAVVDVVQYYTATVQSALEFQIGLALHSFVDQQMNIEWINWWPPAPHLENQLRLESNSLAALWSKAKVKVYLNTSKILEKCSQLWKSIKTIIVIRNDISVSLGMRSSPTDVGCVC